MPSAPLGSSPVTALAVPHRMASLLSIMAADQASLANLPMPCTAGSVWINFHHWISIEKQACDSAGSAPQDGFAALHHGRRPGQLGKSAHALYPRSSSA